MAAVACHDLTLVLGGRPVLAGIDLEIGDAEFIGVLGANGAGKTSLMRAILGLVPPAQGSISVLGHAARRGNTSVGYMPQSRGAQTELRLRGRDFVATSAWGLRWGLPIPSRADRRDIDRVLDLVGATSLADRPLTELSGGERQRLLLAQALLGRPRLLLLDEPLISLDPRHQGAVVGLVRDLQKALGITVLFSTHDVNPLLGALDRVLYLGGGQAALGSVDDVITGPVLSRLYGGPIEVARVNGRVFVVPGSEVEVPKLRRVEHV